MSVTVSFEATVPYDQAGTFPAHVEIDEASGQWQTAAGACSITIAGSECIAGASGASDGGSSQDSRTLSGTGTCAQPAESMANGGSFVTIGNFAFLSSVGL